MTSEPRGTTRFYQLPDDSGKPKCSESNTRRNSRRTNSSSAWTPKLLLQNRRESHGEANGVGAARASALTEDESAYIFVTKLYMHI